MVNNEMTWQLGEVLSSSQQEVAIKTYLKSLSVSLDTKVARKICLISDDYESTMRKNLLPKVPF